MFDLQSGTAIAKHDFVVGRESYRMNGFYRNAERNTVWKVEVYDFGYSMRFGEWVEGKAWNPFIVGAKIFDQGRVLFLNAVSCGYGPGGLTPGEERDISWRLVFSPDNSSFTVEHHSFRCDDRGKLSVMGDWIPSGWGRFVRE